MTNKLQESISLACGESNGSCRVALENNYETTLRADPCAVVDDTVMNERMENYRMWLPAYKTTTCESSGYLNCSLNSERFGPRQLRQESYLQGRGQTTGSASCEASGVRYLPQDKFGAPVVRKSNQELFAQSTLIPRSCGTLTEVDLQQRTVPRANEWQGAFSPFIRAPSIESSMPVKETVTLGTLNKYPDWATLKKQSEPYIH